MTLRSPFPAGRTVLVLADFDQEIGSDLVTTISALASAGARIAIAGCYGDPRGEPNPAYSLRPFAARLAGRSNVPVTFVANCVGSNAEAAVDRVGFGEAALLENLRFRGDAARRPNSFALQLSCMADCMMPTNNRAQVPGWIVALERMLPQVQPAQV